MGVTSVGYDELLELAGPDGESLVPRVRSWILWELERIRRDAYKIGSVPSVEDIRLERRLDRLLSMGEDPGRV